MPPVCSPSQSTGQDTQPNKRGWYFGVSMGCPPTPLLEKSEVTAFPSSEHLYLPAGSFPGLLILPDPVREPLLSRVKPVVCLSTQLPRGTLCRALGTGPLCVSSSAPQVGAP